MERAKSPATPSMPHLAPSLKNEPHPTPPIHSAKAGARDSFARERAPKQSRWSAAVWCILLTLATAIVFHQALKCGFICFDDDLYVDHNTALEAGLSARGIAWAFTTNLTHFSPSAEYWQPLTSLSRLADYAMFRFEPWGHHLTSVVLHLLTGLALFGALRRLTGSEMRSGMVAALFLLHPMHVEPVLWLSARKDVVNALFSVLTLWTYGWYAAAPNRKRYLAVFASVLAANMGKPMAVSLPFLLLLLDVWPLGRFSVKNGDRAQRARNLVLEKVPLFVLTIGVAALAFLVQKGIGALAGADSLPLWCRVGNATLAIATYVLKAFVPVNLAIFYPHRGSDLPIGMTVLAALGIIAMSALAWRQKMRRPWLAFGWLWFLIVLAPVAGIIQIGEHAMADRYSYLAFIGIFTAAVWQGAEWMQAMGRRSAEPAKFAMRLVPVAILICFSALSFRQVQTWRSSESVFRHAIAATSENYIAHFNLGALLIEKGRLDEAKPHLAEARRIREPFLRFQLAAAEAAEKRGDYAGAIPRLIRVQMLVPWDADLHQNLGRLLALNHEPGKALVQFDAALRYRPEWIQPRINIAVVLLGVGEVKKAGKILREVLEKDPANADAQALLTRIAAAEKN